MNKIYQIILCLLLPLMVFSQEKKDSTSGHQSLFSISFNFGLSYCNRITNGDFNSINYSYLYSTNAYAYGSILYPTKNETNKVGNNFSIKLENKIYKHFAISYGIFYQNIGYEVQNLGLTYSFYEISSDIGYTGPTNSTTTSIQNLTLNYEYWGFMAMAKYYLCKDYKSSWFIGAGMKYGFTNNIYATGTGNTYNITYKYAFINNDESNWLSCSTRYAIFNIGKNLYITKNFSVVLESDYMYALQSETRSQNTSIKPSTFSYYPDINSGGFTPTYYTVNWPQLNTNGKAILYSIEFNVGIRFEL
jgi:hypothetical protein